MVALVRATFEGHHERPRNCNRCFLDLLRCGVSDRISRPRQPRCVRMGFAVRNSVRHTVALFRRFIVLSVCLDKLVGHGAAFSQRNRSLFLRSEPPFRRLEDGFGGDHLNYSTPATLAAIAPKQVANAVFPRPAEVTGKPSLSGPLLAPLRHADGH